ncbi:response regulator, partial [bacterium]|nr:response regulator [bacterium]
VKYIICEDNPSVMTLYKTLFKSKNVSNDTVVFFEDGRGAVELIKNLTSTDIFLLTDFNMPHVNGGEVLKVAIEKEVPYKILRTSMDLEDARKVLLTDYQINEGVTFISKQEKLQRLKHEIQEFQENFKD